MEIIAKLNYLRIAPRKVRRIAALLGGKDIRDAERELKALPGRVAQSFAKLLASAAANASHNFQIERGNLRIGKVTVDGGSPLKRSRPRAFGKAFPIRKRTSHVTLTLVATREGAVKTRKGKKTALPIIRSSPSGDGAAESFEKKSDRRHPSLEKVSMPRRVAHAARRVFQRKAI